MSFVQDVAMKTDDFQAAVLMNRVEYKKQRIYEISAVTGHSIYAIYFLKITPPKYRHVSLNEGIRSEKCVVRRFDCCVNVIQCTYTNLDSIA